MTEYLDFRDPSTILDETFEFPPQPDDFPTQLREAIEAFEATADRAEDMQAEALFAEKNLRNAERRDNEAIEAALERGEEPPALEHAAKAKADNEAAIAKFRAYQRIYAREARKLLSTFTEQTDAITQHVYTRATASLTTYQAVMADALAKIEAAAQQVEADAAMIEFVEQLRRGERKHLAPAYVTVPTPDAAHAHNAAQALRDRLDALTGPAQSAYVHVVGSNGRVHRWSNNDQLRAHIRSGNLRKATADEIRKYEAAHD